MSNYKQRQKNKRRKQLQDLGVPFDMQRRVFKQCDGDLKKVDDVIAGAHIVKKAMTVYADQFKKWRGFILSCMTKVSK